MEQAHEQPPASLAPSSDSLKGTKEANEVKEVKEAVEAKCGKPEGKPEGGAQGDKRLDLKPVWPQPSTPLARWQPQRLRGCYWRLFALVGYAQ